MSAMSILLVACTSISLTHSAFTGVQHFSIRSFGLGLCPTRSSFTCGAKFGSSLRRVGKSPRKLEFMSLKKALCLYDASRSAGPHETVDSIQTTENLIATIKEAIRAQAPRRIMNVHEGLSDQNTLTTEETDMVPISAPASIISSTLY